MLKPEEAVKGEEVFVTAGNWKNGVYYRDVLEVGRIASVNKKTVRIAWARGYTTIPMDTPNLFHIRHKPRVEKKAASRVEYGEVLDGISRAVSVLKDDPGEDKVEALKKVLETLKSIGGTDETDSRDCV